MDSGPGTHDTTLSEEELYIKSAAACWILKTKETCKLTQSAMDGIKLHGVVKNALEDVHININDVPQLAKAFDTRKTLDLW